jgi:manganese transport protein
MPHVIFLHSALTQGRIVTRDAEKMRRLYRYERIDIVVALGIAGLINAAILIVSAAAFHQPGAHVIGTLEEAHQALTPVLGQASSVLFGVALLISGISSSAVGTWSGQVIMRGFVNWETPVWLRRSVTLIPALLAIALGLDSTITLVISQVVLSFGLPLALIPLLHFTADRSLMGVLVNRAVVNVLLRIAVALIIALNLFLLVYTIVGG